MSYKHNKGRKARTKEPLGDDLLALPPFPEGLKVATFALEHSAAVGQDLQSWVRGERDILNFRHANGRRRHFLGRVGIGKAFKVAMLFVDERTGNIGVPVIDKQTGLVYWLGRPISFLAKIAGMSYGSMKYAIDQLVGDMGIMTRHQQTGTDDEGKPYGRPSIRHFKSLMDLSREIGAKTLKAFQAAYQQCQKHWKDTLEEAKPVIEAIKRTAENAGRAVKGVVRRGPPKEWKELLDRLLCRTPRPKEAPS